MLLHGISPDATLYRYSSKLSANSSGGANGFQSYIAIILRHLVEHPTMLCTTTLQHMCAGVYLWLRDAKAFHAATIDVAKHEKSYASPALIARTDKESTTEAKHNKAAAVNTRRDAASVVPPTDAVPAVRTPPDYRYQGANSCRHTNNCSPARDPFYSYAHAALATPCAIDEGSFPKQSLRRQGEAVRHRPTLLRLRPATFRRASLGRTAAVSFQRCDFVRYATNQERDAQARKRVLLCTWATSIIFALRVDTTASPDLKDVAPELVLIRKSALEVATRTIKEPTSSDREGLDARYG
ncbi:hypothetical protein PENSPDRAFT_695133 [Peniophora sp. CONT]|nr:hypothetical protein PENSPDRAFT_695133 [Peniophora sp. CONT]